MEREDEGVGYDLQVDGMEGCDEEGFNYKSYVIIVI